MLWSEGYLRQTARIGVGTPENGCTAWVWMVSFRLPQGYTQDVYYGLLKSYEVYAADNPCHAINLILGDFKWDVALIV